jgi:hypothetical protein
MPWDYPQKEGKIKKVSGQSCVFPEIYLIAPCIEINKKRARCHKQGQKSLVI